MEQSNTPEQGVRAQVRPINIAPAVFAKAVLQDLGQRYRTTHKGSGKCECGRVISGNKLFCMACVEKYQAVVNDYISQQGQAQ